MLHRKKELLLTDIKEGEHYVESAYGEDGQVIYIYCYTGENKKLIELKDKFTENYFFIWFLFIFNVKIDSS